MYQVMPNAWLDLTHPAQMVLIFLNFALSKIAPQNQLASSFNVKKFHLGLIILGIVKGKFCFSDIYRNISKD